MENDQQVMRESASAADAAAEVISPSEELTEEVSVPLAKSRRGPKKSNNGQHGLGYRFKKHLGLLWFVLPAVIISFIFSYIPMLGILFAFKDGAEFNLTTGDVMYNLTHGGWTITNFTEIFANKDFLLSVGNTLLINVIRLVLCFPLSIIIAIQLSELKSQTLAKVILIIISIPNFLSWAIVVGIWAGLFDPDFGFLGQAVATYMKQIEGNIMGNDSWFKVFVVALSAWKSAGWGCILYYSAIASIDKTYYESATLEGANKIQKIWYLTLPSIMPTIALTLVLNISGMMATGFEQIWTMMRINSETTLTQITLDTYIYRISIVERGNLPFATALGVFNGIIGLSLMLIGNAITTKTMKRGLW